MNNKLRTLTSGEQEKIGTFKLGDSFVDPAQVSHMDRNITQHAESVDFINNKINEIINSEGVESKQIVATGFTVIIKPHKSNPFIKKASTLVSNSGLIIAPEIGLNGIVKSNDSGEMEEMSQIPCAKVIAVGPECKYCKVGDDVYHRPGAVPIPFGGNGYHAISEQNIICRIIDK